MTNETFAIDTIAKLEKLTIEERVLFFDELWEVFCPRCFSQQPKIGYCSCARDE